MSQGKADAWGTKTVEGRMIGRDNIVIPPTEVEDLAQIGCSNKDIARFYGVGEQALSRNFVNELTKGRETLKHSLRRAQIKLALTGNATMLIWLGKNILGQQESPQSADINILPWTDEELRDEFVDELKEEYPSTDGTE